MNRREILKNQVTGLLWMFAGGSGILIPGKALAAGAPDLAVVKGAAAGGARAAVGLLGGMEAFVKPGARVVIKPNMSFPSSPGRASNTSPEVVRELAVMCKEAGAAKVLVLDHTLGPADACLEKSGIRAACASVSGNMVHALNDDSLFRAADIPEGKTMRRTEIMKEVLKSDVLIAAPTAKSHSGAGVSLSMKGMMGLIYDRGAMHGRYDLHTSIVDLCTVLKADLTVIDGSRVLSTNGPRGPGKVLKTNTIIASKDMVAADAYAVSAFEWWGKRFKPSRVRHIREAHERGLGRMDVENLRIRTIQV